MSPRLCLPQGLLTRAHDVLQRGVMHTGDSTEPARRQRMAGFLERLSKVFHLCPPSLATSPNDLSAPFHPLEISVREGHRSRCPLARWVACPENDRSGYKRAHRTPQNSAVALSTRLHLSILVVVVFVAW